VEDSKIPGDAGSTEVEEHVKYLIAGCGSMGHAICEELEAHGEKFIVIDKNESRTDTTTSC